MLIKLKVEIYKMINHYFNVDYLIIKKQINLMNIKQK